MYRQNLLFLALLTAFASNAIAQVQTQVKAPGCDAIPRLGLRNIQVQYSTEAAVATAFFTRCDTTNYRDYYTDGPPDPAWCEDQDRLQQAETHRGEFLAVLGIYGSAVNAWKRCRESANSGLQITPEIAPDARTVNIQLEGVDPNSASDSETTPDTTEFLGIQHENFRCVVLVPMQRTDKEDSLDRGESYIRELRPNRNRTLREVNKTLRENRNSSNRQTVTVHCERTAPRKEPGGLLGSADSTAFDVLDSGIISILTTAGSMQLYFAEESLPSVASEQALEARMENFESWLPPAAPDPDQQTLRESLATLADSVWDLLSRA